MGEVKHKALWPIKQNAITFKPAQEQGALVPVSFSPKSFRLWAGPLKFFYAHPKTLYIYIEGVKDGKQMSREIRPCGKNKEVKTHGK